MSTAIEPAAPASVGVNSPPMSPPITRANTTMMPMSPLSDMNLSFQLTAS